MADDAMLEHYGSGYERDRLRGGTSRIEFARTKELLGRFLPPAPARILDVGGGPGAYARWLAGEGYSVHLVDAVPLHVAEAAAAGREENGSLSAELGDARSLTQEDSSFEFVLMLGPLYHLTERQGRIRALEEARRVVQPGGIIAAAAISKFASLLDGLISGWLGDPNFDAIVDRALAEGQHRNPTGHADWFTTAFFHHPDELREELSEAELVVHGVFGVEGPGWLLSNDVWESDDGRQRILRVARAVEQEPTLIGASSHLLAIARAAERELRRAQQP